ncbi:helix-turn-helix domain-containing protein [Micromonospora sp. CA-263727]|uniref:helix-turn-helix domain-containing protein n=1 Tax=Micromonospora sp. CA-263727 TaxID=3239967 RepID=UPI003D8C85BC
MDSDHVGQPAVQVVFGLALRQLRTEAGLSLRALGKAVHYDYSRLSRAERGEHLVDPDVVRTLDTALNSGGLLARLRGLAPVDSARRRPAPAAFPATLGTGPGDTVKLELRTAGGRIVRVALTRREFTHLLTTGALRAVLPAGIADLDQADRVRQVLDRPRRLDPQVLGYFRRLLTEHYTADKMLGPRQLLGPVMAQLDVLDTLRRHAAPGSAESVLRLLTQYAEFAGWLHQDSGDLIAAMHWSDRASQWAQAAGDDEMVAYLLVRKSNIATLDNDPNAVIALAAAAQHVRGDISTKLMALASQQEARGWAQLADIDRFRRCLDTAAGLLADSPDEVRPDAPVYLRGYDLDTLEEQSASAYRSAGDSVTAAAILERKIRQTPPHLARDHAHLRAKLANIVVTGPDPDPERAAHLAIGCVDVWRQSGSARIAGELRTLDTALNRRWPTLTGVRDLHEALGGLNDQRRCVKRE